MALQAFLALDQNVLFNSDFSSDSSLKFTGTIYSDVYQTTAFNLTGYTLTLRFFRNNSTADQFAKTCTITSATSGTWYINIEQDTLPAAGLYNVKMELTKAGTRLSTLNRTEILIKRGPTA